MKFEYWCWGWYFQILSSQYLYQFFNSSFNFNILILMYNYYSIWISSFNFKFLPYLSNIYFFTSKKLGWHWKFNNNREFSKENFGWYSKRITIKQWANKYMRKFLLESVVYVQQEFEIRFFILSATCQIDKLRLVDICRDFSICRYFSYTIFS